MMFGHPFEEINGNMRVSGLQSTCSAARISKSTSGQNGSHKSEYFTLDVGKLNNEMTYFSRMREAPFSSKARLWRACFDE